MAEFFTRNIIEVYFFYGLAFFCMGLAILVEMGHSSTLDFAHALQSLSLFGFIHGCHEWFEMFLLLHPELAKSTQTTWIILLHMALLATSFLMLLSFGARLVAGPTRPSIRWAMMGIIIAIWLIGLLAVNLTQPDGSTMALAADVYTRYSLAIPGAALTAWGLLMQRQRFLQTEMRVFSRDVTIAAVAFALYGGIGQLFTSPSAVFPSAYLNADVFVRTFGFPIQVFRAIMAILAAVFIIRSLRAFEVENRLQIDKLRLSQLAERQRLEVTRAELLHRTVNAQEAERQRIARELHDETGQTLTALNLGLHAMADTIKNNPDRAIQHARHLENLAGAGLDELQRLVAGLHPPQLDDLGLLAAMRWYANDISAHYNLPIMITSQGLTPNQLNSEVRSVLFRIAQEAITNAIRHAVATQINVRLNCSDNRLYLAVEDDGQGFDAERMLNQTTSQPCWGLLGMIERATLAGGECEIKSQPGRGTIVEVNVPVASC